MIQPHPSFRTPLLLVLSSALCLAACNRSEPQKDAPSAEPRPASVQAAKLDTEGATTAGATQEAKAPALSASAPEELPTPGVSAPSTGVSPGDGSLAPAPKAAPSSPPKAGTEVNAPVGATEGAPKADAPTIRGPASTGEGFRVHLQGTRSAQVGKSSTVQVVLEAVSPFKCNDKYPYKFTPAPNTALGLTATALRGAQIGAQQTTMPIAFTPASAGQQTLTGEFAFSVCTDDKCLIEKQSLSIPIEVASAP